MRLKPLAQASALVVASVACLAIYHQYRTLEQQAAQAPQVTDALSSIGALSERLDGLHTHGMQQHMSGWVAACVSGPVLSPDSARVAYVAKKQGQELVVEHPGAHEPYYDLDERTLRFSADSKHLAYVAWKTGWRLVVDGTASAHRFPGFVPEASPRFDSPTRVHGLARAESGPGLVRLELEVPSEPGVRAATR